MVLMGIEEVMVVEVMVVVMGMVELLMVSGHRILQPMVLMELLVQEVAAVVPVVGWMLQLMDVIQRVPTVVLVAEEVQVVVVVKVVRLVRVVVHPLQCL